MEKIIIDLEIFRPGAKKKLAKKERKYERERETITISKCDEENESNVKRGESGEKRETKEREETKDQKRERAKRQIG